MMKRRKGEISGMLLVSVYAMDFFKLSKMRRPAVIRNKSEETALWRRVQTYYNISSYQDMRGRILNGIFVAHYDGFGILSETFPELLRSIGVSHFHA